MTSVVSVLPLLPAREVRSEEPEGSGVVIGDGRHVLTARHVVDGATAIHVRTAAGDIVAATLVGGDPLTDLAVLAVDDALPALAFAGDAALGEDVCAIGNAFGLGLTVACGVVSGVHMAGVGFNPIEDFVQTDAAINPGVSGGALVDEEGRLVGLVSAIFTKTSDANIGVNFAVAAPLAGHVAEAILEAGAFHPPRTGARLAPWPAPGETGRMAARVFSLEPGSPADRAGLREGDQIVRVGDRRIRGPADYISAVARIDAPAELAVEAVRDGETINVVLRLMAEADIKN
ncbi:S1C family serine protease [Microbaculum marinisediminis]|uniref:Trypsin-like peptidase domain-containing protein n=1 Tax=Microbaculum marinisediminis TaxID=2931392 RepID=A0AAW5QV39_9HYPH|nr:trypsin-like peptidase domain-containing protein [Microbaculum sp. A6E488]MCT8971092.1 trypsin-like peptidase domain-containing protein [Microbaculum sp. A6E488]